MTRWLPSLFNSNPRVQPSLFAEMDRLFNTYANLLPRPLGEGVPFVAPQIDVKETDREVEICAELPGVEEKDIDVRLDGRILTVSGQKTVSRESKDAAWHVVERSSGSFMRSIQLDFEPKGEDIKAHFENGVLTVTVPKPAGAATGPVKVAITTSKEQTGSSAN